MMIEWFPGHMRDALSRLKKDISRIDVILEILDARLPLASANPLLDTLCRDKFRLTVLNKDDLADPEKTRRWLTFYEDGKHIPAVSICGNRPDQAVRALQYCVDRMPRNRARTLKVMVAGIPNTGKSTILNTLAGRKIARTGNVPAITRHFQRTGLKNNIDIYDTPGVLWPVIEPDHRALLLAASGAISDAAIDYTRVGIFAAGLLIEQYPRLLKERFSLTGPVPEDPIFLIETIGRSRGCLKKGGNVHLQKAAEIFLRELRTGKIGRISFETPEEYDHESQ